MALKTKADGSWSRDNFTGGYGNVDLSTAAGKQAYGEAYGAQRALAKRPATLGVSRAEYLAAQPKKTINFPSGGGGGGGGNNVQYAWDDYDRQMSLMDKIAEMSAGYSTYGTLGDTVVDYEGKKVTQTLSPELQAQYDELLSRSGLSQQQVAEMQKDPQALQQFIYEQNLALKQPAQADLRNQTMETLQAKGMLGSTGGAGLYGQVEESIQRSNAQVFNDAMMQGQSLLDMERARGSQDLSQAASMGGLQVPFMESGRMYGQGTHTKNVEGVSGASANIANQLASRDYGKRKGLWDMMGGGGSGGNLLGGMLGGSPSYIATAATQAMGQDGLRIFEDWRDYMSSWHPTFVTSFGRYRTTAPKIVAEIDKQENSKALYKEIWDDYLKPIFNLIKEDMDNPKALSDYKIMVRELKNKYLRK